VITAVAVKDALAVATTKDEAVAADTVEATHVAPAR